MAVSKWPPDFWPFPINLPSPWGNLIPYIDVLQFLYTSLKEVVNAIPHQPPEYRRDVNGLITALASASKVAIPLGTVGYRAEDKKVLITVNTQGGWVTQEMTMDVQSVIPTVFQLITMLPWDVMGEMESVIGQSMTPEERSKYGSDKPPTAAQIIQWLTDKLRNVLSPAGINIPPLTGEYFTNTTPKIEGKRASITVHFINASAKGAAAKQDITVRSSIRGEAVIKSGAYQFNDGIKTFSLVLNDDVPIAGAGTARTRASSRASIPNDPNLVNDSLITAGIAPVPPAGVDVFMEAVQQGTSISFNTFDVVFVNRNPDPITIDTGACTYTAPNGTVYDFYFSVVQGYIPAGGKVTFHVTATTVGEDANMQEGADVTVLITPAFPAGMFTVTSNIIQGINEGAGVPVTIPENEYLYHDGVKTYMIPIAGMVLPSGGVSDDITVTAETTGVDGRLTKGMLDVSAITPAMPHGIEFAATDFVQGENDTPFPDLSVVPTLSNLIEYGLYNIPVIDYCQAIYEAAMELVESIDHHPPARVIPVIAGGVHLEIKYQLDNESMYSDMPAVDQLSGHTLKVFAFMYDDNPKVDKVTLEVTQHKRLIEQRKILEISFPATEIEVVFTAIETGSDPELALGSVIIPELKVQSDLRITQITQGIDSVDGLPGTFTSFTISGSVTADNTGDDILISPVFTEAFRNPQLITCSCTLPGVRKISTASTAVISSAIPGVLAAVHEVLDTGSDIVLDAKPGEAEGSSAIVTVAMYNTFSEEVEITPENFPAVVLVDGIPYTAEYTNNFTLPAALSRVYSGVSKGTTLGSPLAEAKVSFSASVERTNILIRWLEQQDIPYVGEEFNIKGFNDTHGINRYLHARLEYRFKGDKNTTIVYTDDGSFNKTPHGNCLVSFVSYDAQRRAVKITNAFTGEQVEMRTNAVIWFALQLLLLLPVTLI